MEKIKQLWVLITYRPKAKDLAVRELEDAKRSYLINKTNAEYYAVLCEFETQRINRLEKYIKSNE
jgi:hypothetical protein